LRVRATEDPGIHADFSSDEGARIAKRGMKELGLSLAGIARNVGVTTSSIAKPVAPLEEEA